MEHRLHGCDNMGTLEIILRIAGGVILTAANAFFVMSEFALTRLRQLDRSSFGDDRKLRLAWDMTERLEIYLTGCQLGISTTSVLLGVIAEPAVTAMLRPALSPLGIEGATASAIAVVLAVIVINLIHKIWGEQAPTYLGVERPREVARRTAPFLHAWVRGTYPIIIAGDGLAKFTLRLFGVEIRRSWTDDDEGGGEQIGSRAELRDRMGRVLALGELPEDRRREVLATLDIGTRRVRDIMVPRADIVAMSTETDVTGNLDTVAAHGHTRLPLIGRGIEDFRGIVYVPALVGRIDALRSGDTTLQSLAAPPVVVREDETVAGLIDHFQEVDQELALVLDEDDRVAGLVTTTDAFEAIAGDLHDPLD